MPYANGWEFGPTKSPSLESVGHRLNAGAELEGSHLHAPCSLPLAAYSPALSSQAFTGGEHRQLREHWLCREEAQRKTGHLQGDFDTDLKRAVLCKIYVGNHGLQVIFKIQDILTAGCDGIGIPRPGHLKTEDGVRGQGRHFWKKKPRSSSHKETPSAEQAQLHSLCNTGVVQHPPFFHSRNWRREGR